VLNIMDGFYSMQEKLTVIDLHSFDT